MEFYSLRLKSYRPFGFRRRGGGHSQHFPDGEKYFPDIRIMFSGLSLELTELVGQSFMGREEFLKFDEGPHDCDVYGDGNLAF